MTRDERLDAACAALSQQEPYFAPTYRAARALLRTAIYGAGLLRFPHGVTVTAEGCGCHSGCLHPAAYRIYTYEP